MKDLEKVILSFNNWSYPWKFQEFVLTSDKLSESDKEIFKDIWLKAGDIEIWNDCDLILACKACHFYIKNNYELSDNVVGLITRALSYSWR
ncbi:MAG: hypothetical protein IM600_17185 [Bacteroidetes bacterium]|jgi:hypothetical protein|nr:hypothetical protein [Bacteroidota bacterium]MCA6445166.1 hypothetical protein [Bacteroidota bacterium]